MSMEFVWCRIHVRDKENQARISLLVESPIREKEFGICDGAFVEMITRPDVMRRGYRARQPAYDIDQSVSLDVNLVSLNINYYCLFDTSQSPRRKHYVVFVAITTIIPTHLRWRFISVIGCRLSRVTKTESIFGMLLSWQITISVSSCDAFATNK